MAYELPIPVTELVTLVRQVANHTRPTTDAEVLQGLNYGQSKVVRAISAVRPQAFASYIDPFILTQGIAEYDIGIYAPPVWRPVRLFVPGAFSTVLTFRYKALTDPEYEARDTGSSGTLNYLYYDILTGMLPGTPLIANDSNAAGSVFVFQNYTDAQIQATYPIGSQVMIANDGNIVRIGVTRTLLDNYVGVVTVFQPGPASAINVDPPFTVGGGSLYTLVPMRRRVLRIAPTPPNTYRGRLYYNYRPNKIRSTGDILDGWMSEHRDCLVAFALEHLLAAVNDPEALNWGEKATQMRAELVQDIEPLSNQNSEAVTSGLPDD